MLVLRSDLWGYKWLGRCGGLRVLPQCVWKLLPWVCHGCVKFAGCDQGCSQSALAQFAGARVDVVWSTPLEEILQVSLLPVCSWLQLYWGVLEHTFLEVCTPQLLCHGSNAWLYFLLVRIVTSVVASPSSLRRCAWWQICLCCSSL